MRVVASSGENFAPGRIERTPETGERSFPEALLKRGPGEPFFYCDGTFEMEIHGGQTDVIVERGTEWERATVVVDVPARGAIDVDVRLRRWASLLDASWRPGNTHVHYDHREDRSDERMRREPPAEGLDVLVVSHVERERYPYAGNRIPVGRQRLGTAHVVDVGEEIRHNLSGFSVGYGHLLLFKLSAPVLPISRGMLRAPGDPDYPPLSDGCDAAHAQGGLVLAYHGGTGMEVPVVAMSGKLDAMNLNDPWWLEAEYGVWYRLLNAGVHLPASTGSDWQLSSNGRVYADAGGSFSYGSWLEGLCAGRSLATNGPLLRLDGDARATLEWQSDVPLDRVELVADGEVFASAADPQTRGSLAGAAPANAMWIAGRCYSSIRDSYGQARWAHTSPVWLRDRATGPHAKDAARSFMAEIDRSLEWLRTEARFASEDDRARMVALFREARGSFAALA